MQQSFKVGFLISNSKTSDDLTKIILKVIKESKPQSVEQLKNMLLESISLTEKEIVEFVLKMQSEGIIRLQDPPRQSLNFANYLKTGGTIWYWLIIAVGTTTLILSFTISESVYPWVYAKNLLSYVFILFLPGFAFMKALFLNNLSQKTFMGNLETLQRLTLSIVMSIILVSIVGLLLFYSPSGLNLTTILLSLFMLTSVFATVALVREYLSKSATAKRIALS